MKRNRKPSEPSVLPEHLSGVRSLIAQSHGQTHVGYRSLSEAKADPNGVVVFEGDYGGQIYLVARATIVSCEDEQLRKLLLELDDLGWADPDGASVYFESLPVGSGVAGGMGGGLVGPEIWLHPKLGADESAVRSVILGHRASIHQ